MRLLCVICGLLSSLCARACGNPDCFSMPVRDLALRARVVLEGVLEESPEKPGYDGVTRDTREPDPGAEHQQSRIRVYRVWDIKTGGLRKDSVAFLIWSQENTCFHLQAGIRYVFFTEPTGDASVLRALSPPVQSKRAVRKDITHALCQTCATPKLKKLTNVEVEEGQKVTLKCELLAGGKQTKVQWYQNGKKVVKSETRIIKSKKNRTISELHLTKVTNADVGTYTCTATNERGKDSQNGSVQVIKVPTSTTASAKTSSHMTRCKEEERSYCVNGGECLTVNVTPNSTKHLCRCLPGFTGNRCEIKEPVRVSKQEQHHGIEFMEAEELYQKQILTITGICIALLVVGIMCVVAYCKTKKQRQKLHDRLRQSLRKRNAAADAGNGPQYPGNLQQPPQSLQLVDQYTSKSAVPAQHVIEKETETSFTLSEYTSATQPSTAVTASLSQCWSHKHPENGVCETCVIPGVQNSTPSQRGRLNATGGARDINAYVKTSRETTDSYKDSPYSERFVSTATTPTRLSPVKLLSPATPSSPPSEMSAALPSLATSIPSMATSPLGEEERPLLFLTPPRLREKSESSRAQQLRNSAHYNHGLDEMSPPPSPRRYQEDEGRQEDDLKARAQPASAPHSPTAATHNSKRTNAGSQNSQDEQSGSSSESSSSSGSSSESEAEEERMAEDTPFLIQNAGVAGMTVLGLELIDSSRTNSALHLSPQDDLQSRLASVMANQDPIAV